jgi:hypothetical protein
MFGMTDQDIVVIGKIIRSPDLYELLDFRYSIG